MMANLFGRKWTREELLSHVGDIQRIGECGASPWQKGGRRE